MAYYVTIRDGHKVGWLAGPFNTHGAALAMVDPARRLAYRFNHSEAQWAGFGTARRRADRAKVGLFNTQLGVEPGADRRP